MGYSIIGSGAIADSLTRRGHEARWRHLRHVVLIVSFTARISVFLFPNHDLAELLGAGEPAAARRVA